MKFWKMNGAGNDFIILDGIREKINPEDAPVYARLLCERHLSIGADGLMLVLPAENKAADYRMLFLNSDGSIGEMCGNGARCICRYGYEQGYAGNVQHVETTAGLVTGTRIDSRNYRIRLNDPAGFRQSVSVNDLGVTAGAMDNTANGDVINGAAVKSASMDDASMDEVSAEFPEVSYVELGNPGIPHAVLELPERYCGAVSRLLHADSNCDNAFSKNTEGLQTSEKDAVLLAELKELGRKLRHAYAFQKGANVNFYHLTGRDELDIITFERGVEDFTYACGTGTGSTVYVLSKKGITGKRGIKVKNRGGLLTIDVEEAGIFLTGPTNIVAIGEIRDEEIK